MSQKYSVIINTRNEAKNIKRAINSVKPWAYEIVVVDMESTDDTPKIAKSLKAKVYTHKNIGYVEPARNFAISKAKGDWILILDADEEAPKTLLNKLSSLAESESITHVLIPRKNYIFDKWIKHSRWWPDHNIRFFQKGSVTWQDTIHSVPIAKGLAADLPVKEEFAITHHHYQTVSQFIERLNRYTDFQLKQLEKDQYKFYWGDLIKMPLNEFLSRYYAGKAYKDGIHGLALSGLQAFSEFVLYLKAWESSKFKAQNISSSEFDNTVRKSMRDIAHWQTQITTDDPKQNFLWRLRRKLF